MQRSGAFALSLALAAAACGGKSNRDEVKGTGGEAAEAGAGAHTSSGGAAHASGGSPANSGGTIAASGGAVSGGAVSGGAASGGTASGGAVSGGAASGGAAVTCVAPNGSVQNEFRRCLIDSDCAPLIQPTCCAGDRVTGAARYLMCSVEPPDCSEFDCAAVSGFQTDDGLRTQNYAEVSVICQFNKPDMGMCQTTLVGGGNDAPVACGNATCDPGELCVHRSARGGPAPRCFPLPADGVCPADTEYKAECYSEPGCMELLLQPEPQCAAIPPACGASVSCSCLPPELCGSPQVCRNVVGRQVSCLDISP